MDLDLALEVAGGLPIGAVEVALGSRTQPRDVAVQLEQRDVARPHPQPTPGSPVLDEDGLGLAQVPLGLPQLARGELDLALEQTPHPLDPAVGGRVAPHGFACPAAVAREPLLRDLAEPRELALGGRRGGRDGLRRPTGRGAVGAGLVGAQERLPQHRVGLDVAGVDLVDGAEGRIEPAQSLAGEPTQVPQPPQGSGEALHAPEVTAGGPPGQRRAHLRQESLLRGEVDLPAPVVGVGHPRDGRLDLSGVGVADGGLEPRLGQALKAELPQALQHAVARGALTLGDGEDRAVAQGGHRGEWVEAAACRIEQPREQGRVEGPRGHRRSHPRTPLRLLEQLPAPGDRVLERAVARGRPGALVAQHLEAVAELAGEVGQREGPRSGGGELDGQGQAVERAHEPDDGRDLGVGELVAGHDRADALDEEPHRGVGLRGVAVLDRR